MENDVWIEFCFADCGVFISDWTHHMQFINKMRNSSAPDGHRWEQDFWRYEREFTVVSGKHVNYHIKAYGRTKNEIKALAVWYHINKRDGNFSKYRLD